MRKFILAFIFAICVFAAKAADKSLIITFNDNTTQIFALSDLPNIKMQNDKMTIVAGLTTAEYDLYKVRTFTFGESTGIEDVTNEKLTFEGNSLIIPGSSNQIRIFSIDGMCVSFDSTQLGSFTVLNLESLPQGVYVINTNGKSVKITKK
ncbi:T9SS type A sorting domain-containing protein [Segatella bryantii]|uniref:T9SS type A sorting domain-containing protein n=1 Tax=Segatella bryantii TaxID=77095 RepID=UPI00242CB13B|nr:T9SS type A sorting domain-containing protein [Segatella bryantii]